MSELARPIAADWLALRRSADAAARDRAAHLLSALNAAVTEQSQVGQEGPLWVLDIGAGTGANQTYLEPRLASPTRWLLLDHDVHLLSQTSGALRTVGGVDQVESLIATNVPVLVTCSALLDLLSRPELTTLADALVSSGQRVGFFSLTVNGAMELTPAHDDDVVIGAAFNAHQERDGRPGPRAADVMEVLCVERGLHVTRGHTPWLLDAASTELVERLLTERVAAAVEQDPTLMSRAQSWLEIRRQQLMAAQLTVTVDHVDLLVTKTLPGQPSSERGGSDQNLSVAAAKVGS